VRFCVTNEHALFHNPFNGFFTMRRQVFVHGEGCAWCGKVRRRKRFLLPFLFEFGLRYSPGDVTKWNGVLFCRRSCYSKYVAFSLNT
jgi:hypothetical protein